MWKKDLFEPSTRLWVAMFVGLLAFPGIVSAQTPAPKTYLSYRAQNPLAIDGRLDEAAWQAAPWTDTFVDIEGDAKPRPRFQTRAKMLWDDTFFYIAAELEEPDLWATLTQRDTVIFYDHDFEVFIDPDGDTHAYYEIEVNALETVWDLMLLKPYRDGGPPINAWDVSGMQLAVHLDGTLNTPGDKDSGWTVEMALPWEILREAAPRKKRPHPGDQWRVNFSRVQWRVTVQEGAYTKEVNPSTGKPYPEDNWVWSPQGLINMHWPEHWGYVQFSEMSAGEGIDTFVEDANERVKAALRQLYYRQRAYRNAHGHYAVDLEALRPDEIKVAGLAFAPSLKGTKTTYHIQAPGFDDKTVYLRDDGKIWVE